MNAWSILRYSRHPQSVFLCFWGSAFQDVVCRICPIRLQWTGGHLGFIAGFIAIPIGPIGPSKHILLRSEPRINDFLWSPGLSDAVAVPTWSPRRCYEFVVKLCWKCLFKSFWIFALLILLKILKYKGSILYILIDSLKDVIFQIWKAQTSESPNRKSVDLVGPPESGPCPKPGQAGRCP